MTKRLNKGNIIDKYLTSNIFEEDQYFTSIRSVEAETTYNTPSPQKETEKAREKKLLLKRQNFEDECSEDELESQLEEKSLKSRGLNQNH